MTNIAIENGHLVSFRMKKLWIYSSVNVYQAGKFPIISPINPYKSPWYPYKSPWYPYKSLKSPWYPYKSL